MDRAFLNASFQTVFLQSFKIVVNEASRSKLRGIKAEFAEAKPAFPSSAVACYGGRALFELWRVATPFIPAVPLSAGQGIMAKANKSNRIFLIDGFKCCWV
jgi:hypothetical protein